MKGKFEGIVRDRVDKPFVKSVGTYDTVYYGTLSYFVLVVPVDATVTKSPISNVSDCIVIIVRDKRYYFKLTYGDAYFPDTLVPLDSCP